MNEPLWDSENTDDSASSSVKENCKHLLVDSCVAAAYYVPACAGYMDSLAPRAKILIDHCRHDQGRYRLMIPNFCIAEVFSILAKYRFGKWNKHVKKTMSEVEYWRARLGFIEDIHNGRTFQQHELSRYHILASDLIHPVDHTYEFYRSSRKKKKKKRKIPMSTFDHLIIAMGIEMVKLHGRDSVLLVTADRRLGHILKRAASIKPKSAAKCGLLKVARDIGLEWGPEIYPEVINLATARDTALAECFGKWPLANMPPEPMQRRRITFSEPHKKLLIKLYKKATDESVDSLSYSREFEVVYDAFIADSALDVDRHTVWTQLVNLRKQKLLPTRRQKSTRRGSKG